MFIAPKKPGSKKGISPNIRKEQNRTEQMKTDQNKTEQNVSDHTRTEQIRKKTEQITSELN
eukprot:10918150-Ditylum_brightwellii.AAC.1